MEFRISRTSKGNDEKPCEEAYKKEYIREDERGFATPKEFKERFHEDWFSEGFNHRIITNTKGNYVNDTHIIRDFKDEDWFIEINTLEDLLKLEEKYGELIITTFYSKENYKEIEIYDDYRE